MGIPIASEAENLILEGNVKRRTNRSLRKDTWHLRHYRFDTQECELEYFNKNEKKEQKTKHKIDLKNAKLEIKNQKHNRTSFTALKISGKWGGKQSDRYFDCRNSEFLEHLGQVADKLNKPEWKKTIQE